MSTASSSNRIGRVVMSFLVCGLVAGGCAHPPPTASLAALQPAPPPEPGLTYRIQAGDELHVRFTYQPEMNDQVPVRPDGRISLATTGEIVVAGLMPMELEDLIKHKSSGRLRNPEVVVVVTKIAEQRVYVGGEVRKPGYVVLQPGMSPLQAVVQSGGFRETAKLDSVLLLTLSAGGRFSAARMDMDQVVSDGVPERVRLHPGDVVYVPMTWIADMDIVVDQYVRGLIPTLPHTGVGYSITQ